MMYTSASACHHQFVLVTPPYDNYLQWYMQSVVLDPWSSCQPVMGQLDSGGWNECNSLHDGTEWVGYRLTGIWLSTQNHNDKRGDLNYIMRGMIRAPYPS